MKTLTSAGASEVVAVAVVDVAQTGAAERGRELVTRADLQAEIVALQAPLPTPGIQRRRLPRSKRDFMRGRGGWLWFRSELHPLVC